MCGYNPFGLFIYIYYTLDMFTTLGTPSYISTYDYNLLYTPGTPGTS